MLISLRIRLWRASRVYAVSDNAQPFRFDELVSQDLVLRRKTVAGNSCRLLEASQCVSGHRTKGPRSFFLRRFQKAPERIQVVTRDDCPLRRQVMNKLRIAVIYNVKQIEAITLRF